jgi:hypothetical protein
MTRLIDSSYDRNAANATTALLNTLKRSHTVTTCTDGSVTVDGERIESQAWDDMAMRWDGTADGLEDLGWEDAAEAMRDDE